MQLIDLKAQEEKIDDFCFVIASAANRSIHMVLDCRIRIRSFAMTVVSDCRSRFVPSQWHSFCHRERSDLDEILSDQNSSNNTSLILITK